MINRQTPLSRREFLRASAAAAVTVSARPHDTAAAESSPPALRLGGPTFGEFGDPRAWVQLLKKLGYRAASVGPGEKDDVITAYADAARRADIVIAEVGAWSNPISPDEEMRQKALSKCRERLALADRIGARCCVNISGSRNRERWDGPHPENVTDETFDIIVETTRAIIDDVKPARTCFTLETMPWAYPDSADSYVRLIKAIDRRQFAVHFDPVNLVTSPQRYYDTGGVIREFFEKLGPLIKSCHAKDILLQPRLTTHLDEVRPGLGGLDYAEFLTQLSKFPDTPLMLEHLKGAEEYRLAAEHVRAVAGKSGLSLE
ncbi:MAG: sugar phosphate isomerase/epimerase family protein [Planctomycetota bacterium]